MSERPFVTRNLVADASARLSAPAAERNEAVILGMLGEVLAEAAITGGTALELASGTGQHAAAFARNFPGIVWQPSDRDSDALASIAAWHADAGLANLKPPAAIDLLAPDWADGHGPFCLTFTANLLHISPWEVTVSVLRGGADLLRPDGRLVIYGCFKRDGDWVSDSNKRFDESLRARDASWGVRDTAEVADEARRHGLMKQDVIAMPANNTVMVFARAHSASSS